MVPTNYDPKTSEEKWYRYWMEHKLFHSSVDKTRTPYCIVIPPPNVTGVLHMGHMLNNTIQDVLVRRARLSGKNACWVPGTDHASIATEAKVVNRLAQKGIKKTDLTRDEFLKHAWDWTEEHGGIILKQLRKLGASCDWERTAFTMDDKRSESVIKVFVDLYNKGLIYRGVRMVNWDPKALTALSDEEVIYKEEHSKLYYLRYKIEGEEGYAIVATTRPETIMGDTAMCINPNDPKNQHLKGKKVIVPLVNRVIPVIEDEYVDSEFGTGCLKVTPAHDANDYMLGEKYNLPSIDIFNDNGTLSEAAGLYIGMDRFEVRTQIEQDLRAAGLLEKVESYENKVGYSERTNVPIEPKLSMQWFLKMADLAKPALDAVMKDDIKFYPAKFKNTYRHWMENVKDWCISRQLWWGHRIPAWFLPEGGFVVAETAEKALELAKVKSNNKSLTLADLREDEDCLDTWFSSWLWPISLFDGINHPDNDEINYYYPTSDLVTAPDIIFFWVARMIMAGYEYRKAMPFRSVYFTGIVRDKIGRKMSKSLGNSPDPLDLIEQYGADGVRVGMLLCSPAGGDLLFDESLPEQGRNFTTKMWNAFRLVNNWKVADIEQPLHSKLAIEWFEQYLRKSVETLNAQFDQYRISEALMTVYTGFRDEFSSWLLEIIKPAYEQPIDRMTYEKTLRLFEEMLQLLHPFMPFITEEIWQNLRERKSGESIMVSVLPTLEEYDNRFLTEFEHAKEVIAGIRNIRKQNNVAFKEAIVLKIKSNERYPKKFESIIRKMGNIERVEEVSDSVKGAWSFIADTVEYFIPAVGQLNTEEIKAKLEADLAYAKGFLASVMKKLGNEKFVNGAPAQVIENEKKKQADAEARIKAIEQQLAEL
ncbi:valine--tRNA ligase [Sanguibacteroides justesenii]|uniref:Valine--tRNA ligase n=1 Tax=Sanguibacteroides justesenii TaxID=1547597 RepID=A0AB34R3H4_9PORP|nr:valine--tRNA ligase [Sanguibacteroides justesenii]KIO46143.1 valyl-tRNA synthetase [Sanguibacteroides justesenii]